MTNLPHNWSAEAAFLYTESNIVDYYDHGFLSVAKTQAALNDTNPKTALNVFGSGFGQRLITQMYFEGDPLIPLCPIVRTISDKSAIDQLIAPLDMNATIPMDMRAYKFDIVLRGRRSTLFENRMEGN